jgi:hypothetical protein
MDLLHERHFHKFYWLLSFLVFILVALRCVLVPFAHDEVATFYFYIQPERFIPFYSHPDANGHFLTSLTSWIFFKLFGSEVWSLRIPCMVAFLVLSYSVFRVNKLFRGIFPKIFFSAGFLLSFNFLGFYALCRGYGFSMALLVLALYYFFVYVRYGSFVHFLKFLLFSQLALSANLTLVAVVALLTVIVIFFQVKNGKFFSAKNSLALVLHFLLIYYWVKYAFYLKENGALYYGEGASYWKVTFESLIETIVLKSSYLNIFVVLLFVGMALYWSLRLVKEKTAFLFENNFALSFFCLLALIVGFYLLKMILHVNYPEDRTGLFFYVFFVLSFAFMISEFQVSRQVVFMIIPVLLALHFVLHTNIEVHPWRVYETMPYAFHDILLKEQEASQVPITVGGHRVREFFYGFMNYNSRKKLNHMASPEALQMNCDYALAYSQDQPYYDPYYTELVADKYWGFRLIKRKGKIERRLLFSSSTTQNFAGEQEYYNTYERMDTTFNSENPLLAEFTLSFKESPVPYNAWLVVQVDGENAEVPGVFVRVPLNLIRYNWNGTEKFTTCVVTGNIPTKIKRIVAYMWNIDKKPVSIRMDSFRLYQLFGEGVTKISPAKI